MQLKFKNYDSFTQVFQGFPYHECQVCGGLKEVSIEPMDILIEDRKMKYKDLPILKCIECWHFDLTEYAKTIIDGCYKVMINEGHFDGVHQYNSYKKKFNYCAEWDFKYDHRDYYSIPGLSVDYEHSDEGFLTPVYFTKKSLLHFMHDPDYEFKLFSESYGYITYKDEWGVPFGINRNGKIVFWLGDLSYMDETSLGILKPHNIESDHQLIVSQFYAAQMCCIWSEPNKELNICYKKSKVFDALEKRFNISLHHLEEEIKQQMDNFQKPLIINEKTIEPSINMLHKVLIEGVNVDKFKELYLIIVPTPDKKYKDWKSIKLYEALLKYVLSENAEIKRIIAPLYLLNDLRQYYDHLLSSTKKDEIRNNIIKSFELDSFDIERIYFELTEGLNTLFEYYILAFEY